ncbi:MAG: CDP-diacylglycerol--serine O-phosphatidyltransferase [Candidatus Schekmanbacteria bacterium RIFCSPHIGHO2_02_FULL_38_11]|uniref:CDP-diacylglycerol--serine O-phosphatidyltransferase n=1 Tax=Candidatus Schekmanbacteria bacterium RIFCSPLOWO2_12_FULL_38_15 TaxID=1817883 RepID=A0A1F7SJW1_9BACT|nr:MAG: CDP-diacylglycerol--serine O-phosphatidyltransferase [Candidatus Schekmanbacteria bacterium GWA2_38_9]OGL51730.1 MAG: CDP-diacylglycerol--serine O-phosphatidyltransferase [Candidatus Schekmanbacteria bacterium RIFCSPLOWO2_02_FULL_38_14]OGL52397.1 MAG: CDP-diacylglycerol--serine O-phosphatidyltransferase [Candidatus Schekmanbacteria bacterium RIFCSPHIGHO2_02_FULL_38_11]OGL54053.1 MAG: CDP-diacylglycerol--serine O-phosphatidyltransferase [Candidatus Schekmanbacteria bacterium RIFCSPLOWO2_1
MKKGIYILPSLCTTGNAICGFYSIVSVINGITLHSVGDIERAKNAFISSAYAIIFGILFDGLDGRIARIMKSTSRFGLEFDSLADLISFGIAPGLLVYCWALRPYGKIGWLAALLFVICGALRLARFNTQASEGKSRYFTGLPIPAAAGVIATLIIFYFSYWDSLKGFLRYRAIISVVVVYVLAFLMVSTIKFRSLKEFDIKKRKPFNVVLGLILFIFIIIMKPQIMVFLISWSYAAFGLCEGTYLFVKRLTSAKEGLEAEKAIFRRRKKGVTRED